MIMSHENFMLFASILTAGLGGFWVLWDIRRLVRFVPKGKEAQDEIFGSVIGVGIGLVACIGVLKYYLS